MVEGESRLSGMLHFSLAAIAYKRCRNRDRPDPANDRVGPLGRLDSGLPKPCCGRAWVAGWVLMLALWGLRALRSG